MKLIRGWRDLASEDRGACAAFGSFDGVHRGHQRVIAEAAKAARRLHAPLGAICFEPHPWRWFHPDDPPFLLTTPHQQQRRFAELGVEKLYVLPFDDHLAGLTAEGFADEVLARGLGARHVVVGFDASFGRGRTGDGDMLERLGGELGFGVTVVPAVTDASGYKLSSTHVRRALQQGDPRTAAAILGRPFAIEGVVVEGRKLGRELGFPTANVPLGDYVRPMLGIYATRTRMPDGRVLNGVSSIGTNPTVGVVDARLEVWLFDFDEDIYGQVIETELVDYLRPELKFDTVEAMVEQIKADAEAARRLLG
ncbi:MAG: bifunctional riboflavin kinase/FAD synthetase [Caulobacteraceae bacterium]